MTRTQMRTLAAMAFLAGIQPFASSAAETELAPLSTMAANNEGRGYAFEEPFVYAGPIKELVDGKLETKVPHPTPYVYPWTVEAWFPGESPVEVSGVAARCGDRQATSWRIQIWNGDEGGSWRDAAVCKNQAKAVEAKFPPVKTRGVRLVIEDSKSSSWSNLSLSELRVFGPQQDAKLLPDREKTLKLSTKKEMNVFAFGDEIEVRAEALNSSPDKELEFSLEAEWLDYYLRPVAPQENRKLKLGPGESEREKFSFKPQEQGAYFCRASLRLKGALVSQSLILCGSKDPEILKNVKPFRALKPLGEPSPEALTGEGRILWSTEMYHQSSNMHFLPGPAHFRELKKAGGNFICAMPTWAAVEPLPGVYNFAYYDHCLRLAEEYGLRIEFGLWNFNFNREHKWWLMDEYARKADGSAGSGVDRMFSLAGPKTRESAIKTVEILLKRYGGDPWIGIWQFKIYGHVDWLFPGGYDAYDYSEPYRLEFCRWLRESKGFTLESLAKRHGESYGSWDDVKIGKPVWLNGPKDKDYSSWLELRPLLQDSYEFRDWVMAERCREVYDLIRKYDSTRMIGNWLQPYLARGQVELTDQYAIPGGNNGGETIELIRQSLDMEAPGKWARIEPWGPMNANFGKLKALNWLMFNCGAVKTKQVNYVFPVWEENPCWDCFAKPSTKSLLTELSDAQRPRSRILGLHSFATNHREGRATQSYIELDRWFRMLSYSNWMVKPGNWLQWQLSDGALKNLEDYQLIVDDHSRVMPMESVERLARWVEAGGTLAIFSNSGEAAFGESAKTWPLLKRLGYDARAEDLDVQGARGKLKFLPGNPVFGELKEIDVQGCPALRPPQGAAVLGELDGKPGALLWSLGKGRVLLTGGKLGAYDLGEIWGSFDKKGKDGKGLFFPLREEAQRSVEASLTPFLDAVARWSGASMEQPLRWNAHDGALLGFSKKNGDLNYAVFLNRGAGTVELEFALSGLPPGDYAISKITLDAEERLGRKSAGELAAGFKAGPLAPERMAALRLLRLP